MRVAMSADVLGQGVAAATSALELSRVSKHFGASKVLDLAHLSISRGEFFSLLGPSGCGKTTTLRIVAGLEIPSGGRVFIDGGDATGLPAYQRNIGMVFQSFALFPHMTVAGNVAFGLRMRRRASTDIERCVRDSLQRVGLAALADRYPKQLSGGQQQRVAIARAIVTEPAILLLDEPLGSLDRKLREEMQVELRSLQRSLAIATLMVTHDQDEAFTMSDRVGVMQAGQIVQSGLPRELYERPCSEFVATFLGVSNVLTAEWTTTPDQRLIADARDGLLLEMPAGMPVPNAAKVKVVVRPEKIAMRRGPSGSGSNCTSGVVEEVSYVGTATRFVVRRKGGSPLHVRRPNVGGEAPECFTVGTEVALEWDASANVILDQA